MIKFSLARLDKEPIELDGTEPAEFIGLAPEDPLKSTAPVEYHLNISKVSGGALVRGRCSGEVSGICGRCLEAASVPVENPDIELFLEFADTDCEADITEDIRQELALELPMNLLCSGRCKGLCPHCGANLNFEKCGCDKTPSGSAAWGALDGLKL